MRMLDRKLLRDLGHLRGQLLAIGVVVAVGVATVVMTRTSYQSLLQSRDSYYREYRFADLFVHVKRAPEATLARLAALPGVAAAESRVVAEVVLDVPGIAEPATGRLVSLPTRGRPRLNDVHLRAGRWPDPARRDEVIASEAFAEAAHVGPGSVVGAVLNGRWQRLRVVGVGISPEFVYEIPAGAIFPDSRHFGVLWMGRAGLAAAFDLDGAFNDVTFTLMPGADARVVAAAIDRVLALYGDAGAFGRDEHVSARFIADEIAQNRVSGTVIPGIFLGVAAFLLNVVLARLVATQREQIAALKAFGYRDWEVGLHYLKLALAALALGLAGGLALGLRLAAWENAQYAAFYRFPTFVFRLDPGAVAVAIGVSVIAGVAGAAGAVRRVVALPPAAAMQPEPPPRFHAGPLERAGVDRLLGVPGRIVVRSLERRWGRAALAALGIGLATATLVVGRFLVDSIARLGTVEFREVERQDVTVAFASALPPSVAHELAALPGVLSVEPFRVIPVRLRTGPRSRRIALLASSPDGTLRRLVAADGRVTPVPEGGLLLTAKLAAILGVGPGQAVLVEVLEGSRRIRAIPVAGTVDEMLGLNGYLATDAARALAGDGDAVTGAWLRVDPVAAPALLARLKRLPAVAGVTTRRAAMASFESTLAESIGIVTAILIGCAGAIATAVVYNSARIALSERGRELASLRVLGFSRAEVTRMLLGEQGVLLGAGLLSGIGLGFLFAALLSRLYQWELFRLPLVVTAQTCLFATAVVVAGAAASALIVRRRIGRLDLVGVLKVRE